MIIEIFLFKVTVSPWERGPITSIEILLPAVDKEDAQKIVEEQFGGSKFFDQNLNITVAPCLIGYREVKKK